MKIVSGLIDVARKVGIELDHTQVGLHGNTIYIKKECFFGFRR